MNRIASIFLVTAVMFLVEPAYAQSVGIHPLKHTPSAPSAATGPAGNLERRVPQPLPLPPPSGLTSTTDPNVCSQHGGFGGGLACKASLPNGKLALIWTWGGSAQLIGFHIYRVDGGRQDMVGVQANGSSATLFMADPPPAGACYAVTSYNGASESVLSPSYCPSGGSVVLTTTLLPKNLLATRRTHTKTSGAASTENAGGDGTRGAVAVGYTYNTQKWLSGDGFANEVYRSAVLFDVTPLANAHIRSARLELSVDSAWTGPWYWPDNLAWPGTLGTPSDHSTSCIATIGVGRARWWNYTDWIESTAVLSPGLQVGPDVSFDVTSIVREWVSGTPNFGFVLLGEEENLNAFTEKGCVTQYVPDQVKLEVQYE